MPDLATLGPSGYVINPTYAVSQYLARQEVTPNSGDVVTCIETNLDLDLIILGTGALTSLTIRLPAGHQSMNVIVATRRSITTLTLNAVDGSTVYDGPGSLGVGGTMAYKKADGASWGKL